jgi:uroporphyrin-3 C-methyltransferase
MSDTDNEDRNGVDASFDEPQPARDTKRLSGPVKPAGRGAVASVAWLALFLSLASAAAIGYLYLEKFRAERTAGREFAAIAELKSSAEQQHTASQRKLTELESRLQSAESAVGQGASTLESVEDRLDTLDETSESLESLLPRLTSLERSLAGLQGVSTDARNTYLLLEAEHFLQIANAQLQLAGNPYLATLALEQADDRLLQVGDPALTEVRRALADEVAALNVMEKPDVAGVALTLGSLAQVVESLPLRGDQGQRGDEAASSDDEVNGFRRAWATVKNAVAGLVSYTPPDEADTPLLAPTAEPLLRSNLALQLQAARLALLRGEQGIFEQSLDDADAWLENYFDTSAESVIGARQTLAEIQADYQLSAPPDVSGSLRLLRQYLERTDTRQ